MPDSVGTDKSRGLLLGLLVALVTAFVAASSSPLSPPVISVSHAAAAGFPAVPEASPTASRRPTPGVDTTHPTSAAPATENATDAVVGPSESTSSHTPKPAASGTPTYGTTPLPTAGPATDQTPTAQPEEGSGLVIGESVDGRPIVAFRFGEGRIKVVLVGDIHGQYEANTHILAQQFVTHFTAHPEEVPADVSLWIIPTMNPDGLAGGRRWNANDVDLNRNADTDLDGCAGNDWSPDTVGWEGELPGAGGEYPFSEPETRAMRTFLADAWITVFYHSAAEAIYVDTCQRHAPTAKLAEVLSSATGYPVPEAGWAGYRITGDFGDYLAGEGVASVTVELVDQSEPEFDRNLEGVRALLSAVNDIVFADAARAGAQYVWLEETNTGEWRFPEDSFPHPLALEFVGDAAYLLDGGRVLALDASEPGPLRILLAPGDEVEGVRVLEPLDLAVRGDELVVLDRAGDVYSYVPSSGAWTVARYDRATGDTNDHYYIRLAASGRTAYLLETSHETVVRFAAGERGAPWFELQRRRDVDLSAYGDRVYALAREMNRPQGSLVRYENGLEATGFQSNIELMQPRQVVATDQAVYVLDRAGRRLLAFEPGSGKLMALHQFADRRAVSAIWSDPVGEGVVLAGADVLLFYGRPELRASVDTGPTLSSPQPHDPSALESLRGLSMPIEGAKLTTRDFQLPGAPRHYRLGVHEGIDFYTQTVQVPVDRTTRVRAVADGVVIRATTDYQPLSETQAATWTARWRQLGFTPADVLDGYRGMQVWIAHDGGLVSRYAHLGSIAEGVIEGVVVERGQEIGRVGNSGTPASITSDTIEVHLHLELWLGDHYVGQFLCPIEARLWLERILR